MQRSARSPRASTAAFTFAVAEGFNRMVHGLREREHIKETFGRYVSREIRDEILAGRVALGGQTLDVTILFSDLRDFTPWVEATPATDVVQALNSYFSEMEAAIRGHHGLVLQFIGDEIEAVFGAPVPTGDHPTRAVRAALEMRRRLAAWNEGRRSAGQPESSAPRARAHPPVDGDQGSPLDGGGLAPALAHRP